LIISNSKKKNLTCFASIFDNDSYEILKSISNKYIKIPSVEAHDINLIEKSIKHGVKRFIYASSGSVYGVKSEERVTEDLELVPISAYNKTKMICERLLLSYSNEIDVYIVRPATVCGVSPRMRFDVSVNMLTLQALKNKKITILGGDQTRPNININDMVRVYEHFINNNIKTGIYNAGFENISILDLGNKIKNKINCEIEIKESNDPRSYRQCSDKLIQTGFIPKFKVDNAIDEISKLYNDGKLLEDDSCYTVKWMKREVLNG
jgi:nucleoside-diphosphate-sugar epimerase